MRELSKWPCCFIKRLPKMENWERHCDPQIYRKDFIRRCLQTFTTFIRHIIGFICNCNTGPSSIFKNYSTRGQKNPTSDETPPPPQTTPEQINETTILSTESALQSAASNDVNNYENEIEMLTMSNKRTFNEDSSEEDTNNPLPAKKAATGSPVSEQSGTRVSKGRGGGDLPKISAFPAKTPKSEGRGSSQGDKSPTRALRFSNTGEGSTSSAQGGRNRAAINRQPLLKPPGTIKTATKDKTKSKEKNTPS